MPTCHVKYGEDVAILAGDALLSKSFEHTAKVHAMIETDKYIYFLFSWRAWAFNSQSMLVDGERKIVSGVPLFARLSRPLPRVLDASYAAVSV